jgi:Flp pilus assembly protein TadD
MSERRRHRRLASPLLAAAVAILVAACASQSGSLRGDTFEARKKLTRELVSRGDWPNAFAYADELHRQKPDDATVLVLRGTIYREKGLFREAEADLREAVHLDGKVAEAHAAMGILFDITFRGADAETQHRLAVKQEPQNPSYLNNLGFSLFLRGKFKDAIGYYQQASRLDPTSRRVRTNLGFAYAASGDLRGAAHEFAMGGTPAEAKNNLGFAYERRGDIKSAYDLYLEAARLDPKSTKAHSNLVHAATELGREVPADVTGPRAAISPSDGAPTAGPSPQSNKEDKEP